MGSAIFNDQDSKNLESLGYIADKLSQLKEINGKPNLRAIFYDERGNLRTSFTDNSGNEIPGLKEFAQRIDGNKESFKSVLDGAKYEFSELNSDNGFKAAVFKDLDSGAVITAIAGTDIKDPGDIINDAQMVNNNTPSQYATLESLYNKLKENKDVNQESGIYVVGHSLGGSLGQLLAINKIEDGYIKGVKTFEPYGIKEIIKSNPELLVHYII